MARILIVDDSAISRMKLKDIFETDCHEVVGVAEDGLEGIEQFKILKPDLVTLDVTMPNMMGVECLKEIIAIDADANVVMISALGKGDVILDALNAGALNYITKPFEEKQVLKTIREALE
ncbi:response regulator [Fusibacter ferrireducens]|uniref:Stage 0 sporulation protein A homolog n=1 Tax=Fusibacter ferrireducens TaxID=2785058 RepID=A0ABR9ZXG2_9FIRM|nr:response regulator [Fusibacter ferrireducens]MBF4694833.1 response regulator [Fusibacter ferrireducens]